MKYAGLARMSDRNLPSPLCRHRDHPNHNVCCRYVAAQVGLMGLRRELGSEQPPRMVQPDMYDRAMRIMALDDTCYRARCWLASLKISRDYDWEKGMAAHAPIQPGTGCATTPDSRRSAGGSAWARASGRVERGGGVVE